MRYEKILSLGAAVAITAGGFILLVAPASARPPVVVTGDADLVVRHVSYADLNLASATGEKILNRRVGGAVISVCNEATGGPGAGFGLGSMMARCKAAAWGGARPQIRLAVQRAREIAATGSSNIAAVAIVINVDQ